MERKGSLTEYEKKLLGESCPVFDTTDIPLVIEKGIDEDNITISDCYMGIQYRKGGFKSKTVKVKSVINDGIAFLSGDINIGEIETEHDLDFTYTNRNHADCIHFQSRDTDTWKPAPIIDVNIGKVTLKVSGEGAEDKGNIMFSEPEINDNVNMFAKGFTVTTTAKKPKAPAVNSNNFRNSTFGSPEFPLDSDKICNLPFRVIGNKPNSPKSFNNTIHCYEGLKLELQNPDGFNVIIHKRKSKSKVTMEKPTKIAFIIGHNKKAQGKRRYGTSEYKFWKKFIHMAIPEIIRDGVELKIFERPPVKSYSKQMIQVHKDIDSWGGNISVELHFNASASTARGHEVLYHEGSEGGEIMAANFDKAMDKSLKTRDRGKKNTGYGDNGDFGLRVGKAKSILIEPFFSKELPYYMGEEGENDLLNMFDIFLTLIQETEIKVKVSKKRNSQLTESEYETAMRLLA